MRKPLAAFLLGAIAAISPLPALANPVTMAWSPVGNPGNAPDPATGHGAVDYSYNIGTYDVTVSQYVAFLNSNDPTGADPLGLYVSNMSSATYDGGVSYSSGATAGSKYGVISGDANHPINFPTFYDALRFANWLGNGQTPGSTETGAYTLLGGTPTPSNGNSITRNSDATVFIPNEDEWYKAAYYNPATSSYYSYPTSSNTAPTASGPTSAHNSANYNNAVGSYGNGLTNVARTPARRAPTVPMTWAATCGNGTNNWSTARIGATEVVRTTPMLSRWPPRTSSTPLRMGATTLDFAWQAYSPPSRPRSS